MRIVTALFAVVLGAGLVFGQDAQVTRYWDYPLYTGVRADSILHGLSSIRAVAFGNDVDHDGKREIAATNYGYQGFVHVFEAVGDDSLALVWSSPELTSGGGGSTPRVVLFADLDNDGKQEVIYQSSGNGIFIFEWDGVTGSDNYGTEPSQVINAPGFLTDATGSVEYMEVRDVDGDGSNELLVAYNGASNADDNYYIISAAGDWNTNDPGFSSFNVEYLGKRTEGGNWALDGGTPYAMISANFDGTGNPEILIHNWNLKNVTVLRATGADTYALADTNVFLSTSDDVALMGGIACDIDGDGRDEVYLPTWYGSNTASTHAGVIDMIHYESGSDVSHIDSASNVTTLDLTGVIGAPDPSQAYSANTLGMGWGDIDGNGKKNIYVSGIYFGGTVGFNLASLEFQGGDKTNPANWTASMLYRGDADALTSMTIKDSLGTVDTTKTPVAIQVAHMFAQKTDLDGDGKEDILLPMQPWFNPTPDSTTITTLTWNGSTSQYDTVTTMVVNPRRRTLRVLEGSTVSISGVEEKDFTIIMPDDYKLEQNYPNPFNPSTIIKFALPVQKRISLKVYDLLGKEVRTLIDNQLYQPGTSEVTWDGRDDGGRQVASGTYFYTLIYGNFQKTNKMMLLK